MSFSCKDDVVRENSKALKSINDIDQKMWEELTKKSIIFGHMSVGENIIEGMKEVVSRNDNIKLNIKKLQLKGKNEKGKLVHLKVGNNGEPLKKIARFRKILNNLDEDQNHIAMLKFCYVDINANSDPKQLFDAYKQMVKEVEEISPNIKLIHFTTPLTINQKGLKAFLKKILGKAPNGMIANIKRNEYNKYLLNEYGKQNSIFDLAKFESTDKNGKRTYFIKDQNRYYLLSDEYTYDGGHLNEIGRIYIAEQLMIFLASRI